MGEANWVTAANSNIHFNGERIEIRSISQTHIATAMFGDAAPIADRAYVYAKHRYIGVNVFQDKPAGWPDGSAQLAYLWEVFSRDQIFDTEVIVQITRAAESIVKDNMSRLTRQAISAQEFSEKSNNVDVGASIQQKRAMAAQEQLYEGQLPVNMAVVFLVHRRTLSDLEDACRYLCSCFRRPARVVREQEYAWKIWLQTLPIVWESLLATPFPRRQVYLTNETPGLMSLVRPRPLDRVGLELVSEQGGVPIFLDLYSQHRNLALFATTRARKSVLVSGLLVHALCRGIPVIVMDFPPSDAASTFKDFTTYVGGAYFDLGTQANNLLELPNLSSFSPKEQEERLNDFKEFVASALMTMVFGSGVESSADRLFRQTIRSLLVPAINAFFADSAIMQRYTAAYQGGIESSQWQRIPTLVDFLDFFSNQALADVSPEILNEETSKRAIAQIQRQLRFWIDSRVGKAIARPTTFKSDAPLLVFALRGLSDGDDAAVLALAAYSAALRRTLSHRESIFFIDEFSVLLEWNEIGNLIGRLSANGAKAGIRVILAAQDPNTLATSQAGPRIIQNMTTRLIGRIQPVAIDSFQSILKYPPEVISINASESFFPQKAGMYSQWLMDDGGIYTFVRYYPSPVLLAAVANNPHESAARQSFLQAYADNPFIGMVQFSKALKESLQQGTPLPTCADEILKLNGGL